MVTGKQLAGLALIATLIGAGYKFGLDVNAANLKRQEGIVEEYKRSTQLDAPGLVSSLNQSAEALILAAHERKALTNAESRSQQYAAKVGELTEENNELKKKLINFEQKFASQQKQSKIHIDKLKAELESFLAESQTVIAKQGVAVELIPNHAMLGLSSVYTDRIVANLNGNSLFLDLGESYKVAYGQSSCDLWLTQVSVERPVQAQFKLVCSR